MAITWPISRTALYLIRFAAAGWTLYESFFAGTDDVDPLEWRKVVLRFERTGNDDIVTSLDLLNVTAGGVDTSWTSGDYAACEALLDTFVTTWQNKMNGNTKLAEYRWYKMAFAPIDDTRKFIPSIQPDRLTPKNITGTATNSLPQQASFVLTEQTGLPHHWGRMYMPFNGAPELDSNSEISSTVVDAAVAAAVALYNDLWDADYIPVVPVTQVNKQPVRGLLNVLAIRADSLVDIQRRRRPQNPTYTKTTALS
jgi:hypothetical protein